MGEFGENVLDWEVLASLTKPNAPPPPKQKRENMRSESHSSPCYTLEEKAVVPAMS